MERMTREEAVQYLTKQRDLADDCQTASDFKAILLETGEAVGYTPAFRCLVKGLEPEQSIRWKD
uniref:Ig-like domain-containing protein n=1 Tax=viral metagenome TaxID=1070528 RepID=A0A6M3JBT1_9ZZZZ